MTGTWTGGCACGAVRYETGGAPRVMANCHCRDCQQATGSGYAPLVHLAEGTFRMTNGEPRWFDRRGDRGTVVRRGFCGDCGSPLFQVNASTEAWWIYAASLDNPATYAPSMEMFTSSAQPWDTMHPDLPKYERMPDD